MKHLPVQRPSSASAGFTLIEILVIVLMVGILSAIAVPSYVGWVNNQRTATALSQLASAMRKAQAQARATKINREVRFDNNGGNPRFAIVRAIDDTSGNPKRVANAEINNWELLEADGRGELQLKVDAVSPYPSAGDSENLGGLVFNSYGAVAATGDPEAVTLDEGTESERIFAIQMSTSNNTSKRCILVRTLLGSLEEQRGGDCPL